MGTRSLTHVKDEHGKTLVTMYRQFDGYLNGHGKELREMLGGSKIVNGYGLDQKAPAHFNTMGCLAAWMVGSFKLGQTTLDLKSSSVVPASGIGGFYIHEPDSSGGWEEFVYTLSPGPDGEVLVKAEDTYDGGHVLYEGPLKGLPEDDQ